MVHSALWPRLSVNIFRWIVSKTHFPSDNLKLNLSVANYVEELDFNDRVSMSAGLSMSRPFYKSIDAFERRANKCQSVQCGREKRAIFRELKINRK